MDNVLVTGGAGYIGSHTCKALAKNNYTPVVYDNLSRGNEWAVRWGPLEVGDISDVKRVQETIEKYDPIAVIHFAAYAYVGESVADPLLYYENNVSGTIGLLKAVMIRRVPFVFSSSCATYGIPTIVPITEDHPQAPINPYGYSKLAVERILSDLGKRGLPWVALRYFNAAGADPDGEIGESHEPETHLIPSILIADLAGLPFRVFGNDYDTPDGTCVRDFVHVCDLAEAHVRALEYLLRGGESVAMNLANERGYSVREIIAAAEKISGRSIAVEFVARRSGDPALLVGTARKARELIGWNAHRSDIETQVRDAWRWCTSRRRHQISEGR
jgi:UDP-glucose-4-epimerase GalE